MLKKIKLSKATISTLIFGGLTFISFFALPSVMAFQSNSIGQAYLDVENGQPINFISLIPTILMAIFTVISIAGLMVSILINLIKDMKLTCFDPIRDEVVYVKKVYQMRNEFKQEKKKNNDSYAEKSSKKEL